jgi:hypothetical protein
MGFTEDYSKTQPEQLCAKHSIMYRGICPLCVEKIDPSPPHLPATLYAQKTPSGDVRLFHRDGSIMVTAWSPYQSGCPTHRNNWVTVNCYRWRLVWLPGVSLGDAYSESEDSRIVRQYGSGAPSKKPSRTHAAKPRLTR